MALFLGWHDAGASPPPLVMLQAPADSCPTRAAAAAALAQLLPGTRVLFDPPAGDPPPTILVEDLGPRWRVTAAGESREFADPRLRCEERAEAAAVFAALRLDPPVLGAPPSPRPPVLSRRRPVVRAEVEALGVGALAPRLGGASLGTGGGTLRFGVGGENVKAFLGFTGLAPVILPAGPGSASVDRLPFDAGLRLAIRRGRIEPLFEIGVAGALLLIDPRGFVGSSRSTRLDFGLRAGASLRYWIAHRLGLVAGVSVDVWPRPYPLAADPSGVLATTPLVWLSAAAGVAVSLH